MFKFFGGGANSTTPTVQTQNYISITPTGVTSMVYIAQAEGKDTQISAEQKLYTTDAYVLVDSGSASAVLKSSKMDLDEKTQISYVSSDINGENLKLEKGRVWVDSENTISIELKRLTAKIPAGAIAMVEQTNTAFSVVYAIRGNIEIQTTLGQYTLPAGK